MSGALEEAAVDVSPSESGGRRERETLLTIDIGAVIRCPKQGERERLLGGFEPVVFRAVL